MASDLPDGPLNGLSDATLQWEQFISEEQANTRDDLGMPMVENAFEILRDAPGGVLVLRVTVRYLVRRDGMLRYRMEVVRDIPERVVPLDQRVKEARAEADHRIATEIRETLRLATEDYLHAGTGWIR